MNGKRKCEDWRGDFVGKKVLPSEEVLKYIAKAESSGDFEEVVKLACKADSNYLMGSAEKQRELKEKIVQIKKELIESHPLDGPKIMENGFFWSVCCDRMKDAVLKGEVESMIGSSSEVGIKIDSPRILDIVLNTENGEYTDDFAIVSGECPFCKAGIHEHTVDINGADIDDIRNLV